MKTKHLTVKAPTSGAAMELVDANASRTSILIQNVGSVDAYLGNDSTVTSSTGILLEAGAVMDDETTTDAWFARTASGTGDLRIIEVF